MKSNSRHLFIPQLHNISRSQRLGYKRTGPSGLAELEQLHVESNSECNRHVYLSYTLANSHLATREASGQAAHALASYPGPHAERVPREGLGTRLLMHCVMRPRRAREAIMRIRIPSIYF